MRGTNGMERGKVMGCELLHMYTDAVAVYEGTRHYLL